MFDIAMYYLLSHCIITFCNIYGLTRVSFAKHARNMKLIVRQHKYFVEKRLMFAYVIIMLYVESVKCKVL